MKFHTPTELERARKKGKVIGWFQGAAVVIAAAFLWNLVGWIPTVLVIGAVVYVIYKLLSKSSDEDGA